MTPKVSIIIPSYNCEEYIEETINCILNQTHKNIEIIVVDDGSTDSTREIVSSYHSTVRLITQENARVCSARNKGLEESTGDLICFMDHDDYWYPHKLTVQIEQFKNTPEAGIVYSAFIIWNSHNKKFPSPDTIDITDYPDSIDSKMSGWIYHQLLLDCWVLTSTAMIRREVFDSCGNFDTSLPYSEDWDLWMRICRQYTIIKLIKPTTLYRQHELQGNKIVRDIDYRTQLLEQSVKKWGLCSQDGRCVSKGKFKSTIAKYHTDFGLQHLKSGNRLIGALSILKAWKNNLFNFKYPAYIAISLLGWKPKW